MEPLWSLRLRGSCRLGWAEQTRFVPSNLRQGFVLSRTRSCGPPVALRLHDPLIDPAEPAMRDLGDAAGDDLAVRPTERRRLPQLPHAFAPVSLRRSSDFLHRQRYC